MKPLLRLGLGWAFLLLASACGDDAASGGSGGAASGGQAATGGSGGALSAGGASSGGASSGGADQGGAGVGGGGPVTASDLLALTQTCVAVSKGNYHSDDEADAPYDIPICGLTGAVYWVADLDIDCDGQTSAACNSETDPSYLPETSATDSMGEPLDAATLPFVVIPLPSVRFDYAEHGIELGQVVAVLYGGQLRYGVFGDEGPASIIGEASYAMADLLGIDPDPAVGGSDGPVTYIVFTGPGAVAAPIEDHEATTALGASLAEELVQANPTN